MYKLPEVYRFFNQKSKKKKKSRKKDLNPLTLNKI